MLPEASTIGGDQSVEQLRRELAEAREQQTATAEILRVISSSPMDLGGVFASIAASAARLCDANDAVIHRVDGDVLSLVAHYGPIPPPSTLPLKAGFFIGRAVLDKQTIHVGDVQSATNEYPAGSELAKGLMGTILAVPLIHAGKAVGGISIRRAEVRAFSNQEIELLKTFSDQAVIAIENTRLFEAEQTRTRELTGRTQELTEALEYQTATSDVLAVISHSKFDVQPVLDIIARIASRLCSADDVIIVLKEGEDLRTVAHYGAIAMDFVTLPIGRSWVAGRAVVDRQPIHVLDLATAGDEFPLSRELAGRHGHRTTLGIPLLRDGEAIGCLVLRRSVVEPFAEKQIALLQTFADQAVIAIENTRLFEAEQASKRELQARTLELTESLEQQTATADVLKVISRSALDVQKVLDALV